MIKKNILLLFLSVITYGQNLAEFNAIYEKTFLEIAVKDMPRAVNIADSLYQISETPILQIRSLMLSATLHDQTGDLKRSIEFALQAKALSEKSNDIPWQAKTTGFLASRYRILKLYKKSKTFAEEGLRLTHQITDPRLAANTKALMYQEMAYHELDNKSFQQSIDYIHQADLFFKEAGINVQYFSAQNHHLLGKNFYGLGNFAKAIEHYKNAKEGMKKREDNFLKALIYAGLCETYISQGNLDEAKKHLDTAVAINENFPYLQLNKEVLEISRKYFTAAKDLEQLNLTHGKSDTLKALIKKKEAEFLDDSIVNQETQKTQTELQSKNKNYIIVSVVILLMIMSGIYFHFNRKQKRNIVLFKKTISALRARHHSMEAIPTASAIKATATTHQKNLIPAETEQKILAKLSIFEQEEIFTDNSITLSYLATYCDTNVKYLSYIINTHKGKDFNNYINELRVNYIIDKLELEKYRKYKISILAEEAGFSSHNKFSTVFKFVTGFTPSYFIKNYKHIDSKEYTS